MNAQAGAAQSIAHLEATLKHGNLSAAQKERGAALLQRLNSPVRLTILGLPKSGKTEILNLLAGKRVIPTGIDFPTLELGWDKESRCRIVMSDGSDVRQSWPPTEKVDWSQAVYLKVTSPLEILKRISFLEVVTDGSGEDFSSALNWAIPRTDIAVWCTKGFNRLEHALWVQVPDGLKDHGFLVLSKADELAAGGKLAQQIKRLGGIAAEEFRSLHAVASAQYLTALNSDGVVSPEVRKRTGAGQLLDAVTGHVRSGRQADIDGAMLFLSKFGISEIPDVPESPEMPVAPEPDAISAAPVQKSRSRPEGPETIQSPAAAGPVDAALTYLHGRGRELAELGGSEGEIAEDVLGLCCETVEHLIDMFADSGAPTSPLSDEIEAAGETLILMQLERGDDSAADAATVLLQISRELKRAQAA